MSPRSSIPRRLHRATRGGLLALPLALGLSCGGCLGGGQELAPASHLILITVDTWRGDHLLAPRSGVFLTPRLAAWAARSARFTAHSSAASETSPGMASIFTGLLPRRSGVLKNSHLLQDELTTLPALLGEAGFATAGFVANPVLRRGVGFDRGFGTYEVLHAEPPARKTRAREVLARGLRWLDSRERGERFFLWLHLMEPHGPYEPEPWATAHFSLADFGPEREVDLQPEGRHSGWRGVPWYQQRGHGIARPDARDYELRYAAEVLAVDEALHRFLTALQERRLFGDAVVVLTADHGEALGGDHGYFFSHGHGPTEDQIHVPLLVWAPGIRAGERHHPTSSVDVLPSALRLLGLPAPAVTALDGDDLFVAGERPVIAETNQALMVRRGEWKLRWSQGEEALLHHLARDPGEARDLAAAHPEMVARLRADLRRVRARPVLAEPEERRVPAREERRRLRALGYL